MPRQRAVIGVLAYEAFAEELVDRADGPRLRTQGVKQPLRRKTFRGEKSEFRRKPRREVDLLVGDATKARRVLNWTPKIRFKELARLMVESDLAQATKQAQFKHATAKS